MTSTRILIAGIGNIFRGDDAFGVEVAQRLLSRDWHGDVTVTDFGIRGIDLAYALLDDYDAVLLLDATQQGGDPGTLYVMEPDLDDPVCQSPQELLVEAHGMIPKKVLSWAKAMGARLHDVRLIGCEPANVGTEDDMITGLSEPVQAAVDEAVRVVEQLVDKISRVGRVVT